MDDVEKGGGMGYKKKGFGGRHKMPKKSSEKEISSMSAHKDDMNYYKLFNNIPINKTDIEQGQLDIIKKNRSNLFSWNGQFSPQLIEVLLNNYANEGDIIFDPFVGSGTTLCEAARKGLSAFGNELNASAYFMAKTYELATKNIPQRFELINSIEDIIYNMNGIDEAIKHIIYHINRNSQTFISNLLSTLIVLLDIFNNNLSKSLLYKKWEILKNIILSVPISNESIHVYSGDARKIECCNQSASLLITSPPYINVFNYHQKYRRSVELLGYDILKIAKKEFGANRKFRNNRFLTCIQYCIDIALSVEEAIRICRPKSRMIIIIGRESKILGYPFCNSAILYFILTEIYKLPLLLRQERVFKNRFGQFIFEDILHFETQDTNIKNDTQWIITKSRNIAIEILYAVLSSNPPNDNTIFLHEAIDKADEIGASEF